MEGYSRISITTSVFLLVVFINAGCISTKKISANCVGRWNYIVHDTPEGDVSGFFTINQEKRKYSGKFKLDGLELEMQDLLIKNNKISCYIIIEGYKVVFQGEFDGDKFSGKSLLDENIFIIAAVRAK